MKNSRLFICDCCTKQNTGYFSAIIINPEMFISVIRYAPHNKIHAVSQPVFLEGKEIYHSVMMDKKYPHLQKRVRYTYKKNLVSNLSNFYVLQI